MELLHVTARTLVAWMIYCLIEGTGLALFVWVLLRLLPRQNARTRFALWFSVLLTMAVLPFAARLQTPALAVASQGAANRGLITLPVSWAITISAVWLLIAVFGLMRLLAGVWQVSKLRGNSKAIDLNVLPPQVLAMLDRFPRRISLRSSDNVEVACAIGFFRPAIMVPCWFLKDLSPLELKQVLLHELTHLRRRDDWTNLAQKIMNALLFFQPLAWWLEHRLTLEREMACDEAVLEQASNPREYADCLRRVAEKSFLKRQMALVQAVVSRVRQLSFRVARILDVQRPSSTRLWKPAVPAVIVAASLFGFSAWKAPALISFNDTASRTAPVSLSNTATSNELEMNVRSSAGAPKLVLANATLRPAKPASLLTKNSPKKNLRTKHVSAPPLLVTTRDSRGDYVVTEHVVVLIGDQNTLRVQMWQVRVLIPTDNRATRTASRKNI